MLFTKKPLYYDLMSLYEVNNTLTETKEMHESGQKIADLIIKIAIKAKEEGTLNPNINLMYFSFCIWGKTVGVFQLIKVSGTLMNEKMNITEEDLLNTFLETFENGVGK
jgi:TetR/AcrR family transcriptional regulator